MRQHTPRLSDQTIFALEARRDQLENDFCQLHLDELGASQSGDDAGAEEAAALMRTIEAELHELAAAIAEREAEIARVRSDFGPFSLPHPPINLTPEQVEQVIERRERLMVELHRMSREVDERTAWLIAHEGAEVTDADRALTDRMGKVELEIAELNQRIAAARRHHPR